MIIKMKKAFKIVCIMTAGLFFILYSCKREDVPLIKEKLTGFVQKGPFINGTSITLYELDKSMIQTGRNFGSQIIDNSGTFEIPAVELTSPYAELKADGFYYNEVLGETSAAQLTLYALTNLSDRENVNINILTHLEKRRVEYLIDSGFSFNEAKAQAQQEILKIFEVNKEDIKVSEALDISKEGEDNAILLAISIILQGYRTVAELSELLATISADIREDGTLDNAETRTVLINHSKYLNLNSIKENLNKRYQELGIQAELPDFEKYVTNFNENSDFVFTYFINYPEFSNYGQNILFPDLDTVYTKGNYSLAAELPTGVKFKVILSGNLWYYESLPNGPVNWTISDYDFIYRSQIFESTESGKNCDLIIDFMAATPGDKIKVDYYENTSLQPTTSKEITVALWKPAVFIYPDLIGRNILNTDGSDSVVIDESYAMRAEIPALSKLTLTMKGTGWSVIYPSDWIISPYDDENNIQVFTSPDNAAYCEQSISFSQPGLIELFYKEESPGGIKNFTRYLYVLNSQSK
jgi:hypothetical protein